MTQHPSRQIHDESLLEAYGSDLFAFCLALARDEDEKAIAIAAGMVAKMLTGSSLAADISQRAVLAALHQEAGDLRLLKSVDLEHVERELRSVGEARVRSLAHSSRQVERTVEEESEPHVPDRAVRQSETIAWLAQSSRALLAAEQPSSTPSAESQVLSPPEEELSDAIPELDFEVPVELQSWDVPNVIDETRLRIIASFESGDAPALIAPDQRDEDEPERASRNNYDCKYDYD